MENPIFLSKKTNKPFIYYHTHRVHKEDLDQAIKNKKSIELDVAIDEEGIFYKVGSYYIGHPVTFYTEFKEEAFHNNMPLEEAVSILEKNPDIFVVLDCKNVKALSKMEEIVNKLGVHRCLFHAYAKEWDFRPFEEGVKSEAYWDDEGIPFMEIVNFKKRNKVPVIAACRALSADRLRKKEATKHILEYVNGTNIDCVSFYMQGTELPPLDLARQISQAGFLNWINIDKIEGVDLSGITYIGMTDVLDRASDFKSQ